MGDLLIIVDVVTGRGYSQVTNGGADAAPDPEPTMNAIPYNSKVTDPALNKPASVEAAADWLAARGVEGGSTHSIDGQGRHLVRGWWFRGINDMDDAFRAISAAKAGGFHVDSFRDDGDWALVIDASKVPAA